MRAWGKQIVFAAIICAFALAINGRVGRTASWKIGDTARVTGSNWIGCKDKDRLDKLNEYAHQHDEKAFKRLLAHSLLTGECRFFKSGEIVYITALSFLGYVKVRLQGEVDEFWVLSQALTAE